ncbi:MAG: hypothetical protein PVG85_07150 [Deltaproteobacteria bacterium]|jgi:alkylhydroperoxidase/carboxymuconolactone decarboxylase family protein YurZ
MSRDASGLTKKELRFSKKWAIMIGCVLVLVLTVVGYFGVVRPVIVLLPEPWGLDVKNQGGMDALIYRVDGFWYWGGQVALLHNMPAICQQVEATATPVRLQLPSIPTPSEEIAQKDPCYMKLAVRYKIPGIPTFRYTSSWYFEFDPQRQIWESRKSIPPKYRSLGNLAMGNVGRIELEFH